MYKLEVGKPFKEGATFYQEGIRFDLNDDGMDLVIYYSKPSSKEKEDIKKGNFKCGYLVDKNVILMFFKFGQQDWMDASFTIHKAVNLTKLDEIPDGQGYSLKVHLVDASTGVLKVMRMIGLDTTFSRAFRNDALKQKEMDYSGFDETLNRLYRHPTDELVKNAKVLVG